MGNNYSFGPIEATAGQVFENANLSRILPHTPICEGVAGLVFRNCNLMNCVVPADSIVQDCLTIQKSFCSHIHSEWVGVGLPECAIECSHLISSEAIEIDGTIIDTVRTYEDTIV